MFWIFILGTGGWCAQDWRSKNLVRARRYLWSHFQGSVWTVTGEMLSPEGVTAWARGKPLQSFQVRYRKTAALYPPWYFSCMFINGWSSSTPIKSNLLKRFGMLIYNLLLSGRRSIYCYGDGTSRSVADVELFMWPATLRWTLPARTWGVVIQTGPGCMSELS